jgi:regulator of cell morphogenesis and NO signaling
MSIEILDVTRIEPRLKHPTIFNYFDKLPQGEAFIILNDHDPKPLYYQMLGERGNIFSWEYLEKGPEWWKVKIGRNTEGEPTIGEIAAGDIRKAEVFRKMGIDFCCGGKATLKQAAQQAGVTEAQLQEALEKAPAARTAYPQHDFASWDAAFLADYICNVHHRYIRNNAPVLEDLAVKVAGRHGAQHPELIPLSKGIGDFLHHLLLHLDKEENILFPIIRQLASGKHNGGQHVDAGIPIRVMEKEHQESGDELKHFRRLTHDYALPEGACDSYAYLFGKLKEFEEDLFQHIHLENNILFPKVLGAKVNLGG